jgi:hypothetical protein
VVGATEFRGASRRQAGRSDQPTRERGICGRAGCGGARRNGETSVPEKLLHCKMRNTRPGRIQEMSLRRGMLRRNILSHDQMF